MQAHCISCENLPGLVTYFLYSSCLSSFGPMPRSSFSLRITAAFGQINPDVRRMETHFGQKDPIFPFVLAIQITFENQNIQGH